MSRVLPQPSRRRKAAFTIVELLMAMAITLILMAIVSDILNNIHKTVSIGAANSEVITYAAAFEQHLRDDFRRLNPQGFIAIRYAQDYFTTNGPFAPGEPGSVVTATPTVNAITGAITAITLNQPNPPTQYVIAPLVTFVDPAGTGSGAIATATLDPTAQTISTLNIISGGSNYSTNTQIYLANPTDQICFFANGPWVTTRYDVQTTNSSSGGTTDSGYARTFQSDQARIWYGHLYSNELLLPCTGAANSSPPAGYTANSFTVSGNYVSTFSNQPSSTPNPTFIVAGTGANNGTYSYTVVPNSNPSYNPATNTTTIVVTSPAVPNNVSITSGYIELAPSGSTPAQNPQTYAMSVDENGNTLLPQYWRLGRHALLLSDDTAVRYDGLGVDASTSPAGAGGAALLPQISLPLPGSLTGFSILNPGSGYTATANTPAVLFAPPVYPPSPSVPAVLATLTGGTVTGYTINNAGGNLRPLYASQSIWQATDYVSSSGSQYYGIEPGLSDVAAPIDLPTIEQDILSTGSSGSFAAFTPPNPPGSFDANWVNSPVAQRIIDACFPVYGTPFNSATNVDAELTMPNQSVLAANCSAFSVEVGYKNPTTGAITFWPRPSGALITATINGGSVQSPLNVLNSGVGYYDPVSLTQCVFLSLPASAGAGTGAVLTPTFNATGGFATVSATAGSGYNNGTYQVVVTPYFAAGYGQGASAGCRPWPQVIRITVMLHDQKGTIHNLTTTPSPNPQAIDGRLFTYILEVPQQ